MEVQLTHTGRFVGCRVSMGQGEIKVDKVEWADFPTVDGQMMSVTVDAP